MRGNEYGARSVAQIGEMVLRVTELLSCGDQSTVSKYDASTDGPMIEMTKYDVNISLNAIF